MKIDIPYYSQFDESLDEYWQKRACDLVCLKMVLDFHKIDTPEIDEFLKIAIDKGSFGESGWIHNKLLELAKGYGLKNSYRKEFKFENIFKQRPRNSISKLGEMEEGIGEIVKFLEERKPVIVSVIKRFKFLDKFHQVVLIGFEKDEEGELKGFYYNDSGYQDEERKNLFVDIDTFEKYWKKMGIFLT